MNRLRWVPGEFGLRRQAQRDAAFLRANQTGTAFQSSTFAFAHYASFHGARYSRVSQAASPVPSTNCSVCGFHLIPFWLK